MSATIDHTPYYKRLSFNLLSIALLGAGLYIGQDILIPLFISILMATLLLPVMRFLQEKGLNKALSIILPLLLSLLLMLALVYFLSSQVANFLEDIDAIKKKLGDVYNSLQDWVSKTFNVTQGKQDKYVHDAAANMKGGEIAKKTVGSLTTLLSYLVFLPIYTFLFLYYSDLIKKFLIDVFKSGSDSKVREIIHESRLVSGNYIMGLMIEMSIVFALNTAGFLILGIKYAVFLALVAALLNLVPYIGMLVANIFCMLITLVSSDNSSNVIWVGVILAVVQIVDNNFLMPMIVGSKVRINALVTLIGVLVGGAICGVPGMFLSIPGLAVLKVIFDRVDGLKPYGMVLGDDTDKSEKKTSIK